MQYASAPVSLILTAIFALVLTPGATAQNTSDQPDSIGPDPAEEQQLPASGSLPQELTILQPEGLDPPDPAAETPEPLNQLSVPLEQITVVGQRSFFTLRAQIETAREALYSTYNDFNLDDDYDVNCRQTNWTGTHIQEQQCWPVFFERVVTENSQDALINGDLFVIPVPQLQTQYNNRFDELRANILKVANGNPPVAEALMELGTLENALERKKQSCEGQPAFLGLFRLCP